ncbi:MFS multidrug transporter [Periconia macrospinosa]|uniref:MFS multidrug transporter n=1 Tax=Periconia macrospinosa TaxID=97972 RepID=A0A2V1D396_9PLEO|nr:MFS multidrug transporter [Periconia macrospinosa]
MDNSEYVERLGRQRPAKFKTLASEVGFCFSIMTSQIMAEYFISGFNVIIPVLAKDLDIPPSATVWPASAFALTAGSSLLIFGRFADQYGGYIVYTLGLLWHLTWTLIAGFSTNQLMLNFCRALQGFGPAAFLSSGIMLLGSSYRPGPRKNIVFSIYGGCAPVGFFSGIFVSGLSGQWLTWRWYFWIGAILVGFSLATAVIFMPSDFKSKRLETADKPVQMDWLGAACLFAGLVLTFYAVNDGAHAPQGWSTPYIIVCFILGILLLGVSVYVEGWVATQPLLPASLFKVSQMKPFLLALFFSYGVLGTWLLYTTLYAENIMSAQPMQLVAWFVPFAVGGLVLSPLGGYIFHKVPGTVLLVISGVAWIVAPLLFAIAPQGASYWAYTFPAMICGTLGIDITYNIANVFVTSKLPDDEQGLAGAVCNSILFLGVSFFLGFADLTAAETASKGSRQSYKAVFWYAVGCATVSVVLLVGFVKIEEAKSELKEGEESPA